mgnify:CR=1 FL=1
MTYSGIIYRRYIINDKGKEVSYVGQTCDPDKRNSDFLNLRIQYGGLKIENARKKYGPEKFSYEVLETVTADSETELSQRLNALEIQYIEKYNSFEDGYNHTLGGGGANGYRHTEEYKAWQSRLSTELNNDPEFKQRQKAGMSEYFSHPEAHAKTSAGLHKRYSSPEAHRQTSEVQKKSHAADPDRAKRQGQKLSQTCSTPEGRKRMSETSKAGWKKPEVVQRQSERMVEQWSQPGYKEAYHTKHLGMNGKRVRQITMDGRVIKEYVSACSAAEELGLSFGSISRVCRGERTQYKGYKWEYVDEN